MIARPQRGSPAGALLAVLIASIVAVAACPSKASATDARYTDVTMRAQASRGYDLLVSGQRDGSDRNVAVRVSRGHASATYALPRGAKVSRRALSADLGRHGRVAMSFRERSVRRTGFGGRCGFREVVRRGIFRGRIVFRGEHDFTNARITRAEGSVRTFSFGCQPRRQAEGRERQTVLSSCGPGRGVGFFAARRHARGRAILFASKLKRTRRLIIVRDAYEIDPTEAFTNRTDLSAATVRPNGPAFSGKGRYESGVLFGDLVVELPGAGTVPLTVGDATLRSGREADLGDCTALGAGRSTAAASADAPVVLRGLRR